MKQRVPRTPAISTFDSDAAISPCPSCDDGDGEHRDTDECGAKRAHRSERRLEPRGGRHRIPVDIGARACQLSQDNPGRDERERQHDRAGKQTGQRRQSAVNHRQGHIKQRKKGQREQCFLGADEDHRPDGQRRATQIAAQSRRREEKLVASEQHQACGRHRVDFSRPEAAPYRAPELRKCNGHHAESGRQQSEETGDDPPDRPQEKRERRRDEGVPKMDIASPRPGFHHPQEIIRWTETSLQAADLSLIQNCADDLREWEVQLVAQEIKDFVVVDESPVGQPYLSSGQNQGNRSRPDYDQQSQ